MITAVNLDDQKVQTNTDIGDINFGKMQVWQTVETEEITFYLHPKILHIVLMYSVNE